MIVLFLIWCVLGALAVSLGIALASGFRIELAGDAEDRGFQYFWINYASFSEDEQAVMELADEIALNNREGEYTPALHAKLKRHFSDEDILELAMCLGVIVGLVKLSFTLGLVQKESYCEFGASAAA